MNRRLDDINIEETLRVTERRVGKMSVKDLYAHILKGEQKRQNTDFTVTEKDIADTLKHLNSEQLNKVAIYITDLRRAAWGVSGPPGIDEEPKVAPATHAGRSGTGAAYKPPHGGFPGTMKNPIPIKKADPAKWVREEQFDEMTGMDEVK